MRRYWLMLVAANAKVSERSAAGAESAGLTS